MIGVTKSAFGYPILDSTSLIQGPAAAGRFVHTRICAMMVVHKIV